MSCLLPSRTFRCFLEGISKKTSPEQVHWPKSQLSAWQARSASSFNKTNNGIWITAYPNNFDPSSFWQRKTLKATSKAIEHELHKVLRAAIFFSPTIISLINTIEEKYATHPSQMKRGIKTVHHDMASGCSVLTASNIEKTNNETMWSHISKIESPSQVFNSFIVRSMAIFRVEEVIYWYFYEFESVWMRLMFFSCSAMFASFA